MIRLVLLLTLLSTACTTIVPVQSVPVTSTTTTKIIRVAQLKESQVPDASEPKVVVPSYVGKTIDEVILINGQPIGSADMGNGIQAFQFFAKPNKPKCVASYLATKPSNNKPWVVQEYIAPETKTCE